MDLHDSPHLDAGAGCSRHWRLDPSIAYLNHGSFGACPIAVLEAQRRFRDQMEREPVRFFLRELEGLLTTARQELARFVGADSEGIAFVSNASSGVNTVLRSLPFKAGDELLITDHAYNACRNALHFVAANTGARVVLARVPFPIASPEQVIASILEKVTPRTRLALVDHVTSPTGIIFPVARLVKELALRGVDALVDGAHAPGMLPLDVRAIDAAYYTGNCHKWVCAPKGAAFLHVREDKRAFIHPLTISHGANSTRNDRSRFRLEFDWTGTDDPSAHLCIREAIDFMGSLLPGGWTEVMSRNHALAVAARDIVAGALQVPPPAPDEMIGSMAALPMWNGSEQPPESPLYLDPLQSTLLAQAGIEVPMMPWPAPPKRLVRLSAQLYNHIGHYQQLAQALVERAPWSESRG